ncbi:MAG: hypothetical protein HUK40_21345 [Desulfobacter sp.]|nr:hypothetical protein [Desulfobacter sp.]WDP88111.1 MAG: hypothetical protein HUN05_16835 [Desulfobacter sp.]
MCFKKRPSVLLALLILILAIAIGCGKKGMPLAPLTPGNILAAPANLSYTLKHRQVILNWTHEIDPENAKIPPEGFELFVATKALEGCEGCPFIFKSAGKVSMPAKSFTYDLDQDLHYYFRIQAMGKNNIKSQFSDTLYIDFP